MTRKIIGLILICALVWTDFTWAGEVAALSPSSRFGGIEGLYRPVDSEYFRAIRDECFKGIESPFVLVPASGSDISSVLLLTDATYAVCIDLLPFGEWDGKMSQGEIAHYFSQKKVRTYTSGDFLRIRVNLRPFVVQELDRIGATNVKIVQDRRYRHVYHVHFNWAYPDERVKARTFTFVGETDVEDIANWLQRASVGNLDGLILKAGEYVRPYLHLPNPSGGIKNPRLLIKKILTFMKTDSYVVSDCEAMKSLIRVKSLIKRLVSVEKSSALKAIEERGAQFGYAASDSHFVPGIRKTAGIYQVKARQTEDPPPDSERHTESGL